MDGDDHEDAAEGIALGALIGLLLWLAIVAALV